MNTITKLHATWETTSVLFSPGYYRAEQDASGSSIRTLFHFLLNNHLIYQLEVLCFWRRGSESNRRIKVLQSMASVPGDPIQASVSHSFNYEVEAVRTAHKGLFPVSPGYSPVRFLFPGESMTNTFEIRGVVTAIHIRYKNLTLECLIDTADLPAAHAIPGQWHAIEQAVPAEGR